jgi:hypothetical protein
MTFPLITNLRLGSGWQARISADEEPGPIPNRILQEAAEEAEESLKRQLKPRITRIEPPNPSVYIRAHPWSKMSG